MARRRTAGRGSTEQPGKSLGFRRPPVDLEPARIVDPGGPFPPDAIDGAQHVGLGQLRGRAAELVPAARVDHEQAAVGIFEHVGGMKVGIVGGQEIADRAW